MPRISITLTDYEYERLSELARDQYRTPNQQLRHVLDLHLRSLIEENEQGNDDDITLVLTTKEADFLNTLPFGLNDLFRDVQNVAEGVPGGLASKIFRQYHNDDGNIVRHQAEIYSIS